MVGTTLQTDLLNDELASWDKRPLRISLSFNNRSFRRRFDELVRLNPHLVLEQTSNGDVIVMCPTGGESGDRNSEINMQLRLWCKRFGGRVFDSSTLFRLPNGAGRSPDASWVSSDNWNRLTAKQRKGFPPICPDFVVELRSESDRPVDLQAKMKEYLQNGAKLGWLIDPLSQQVQIYCEGRKTKTFNAPKSLSGEKILPGFELDLSEIWAS